VTVKACTVRIVGMCASLTAAVVVSAAPAQSSCPGGPYSLADLETVLKATPEGRVLPMLKACGSSFIPDDAGIKRLRSAGASDLLVRMLAPPPTPAARTLWTPLTDRREMGWIPPGQFSMGSPAAEPGHSDDETEHATANKGGFWLDTTEVTNEAYRRFLMASREWSKTTITSQQADQNYLRNWTDDNFPPGEDKKPVTYVSWHAAQAYARWAAKRLPTEAEWEFAARAGESKSAYPWGQTFDSSRANNSGTLWPVGTPATANGFGLFDMIGNVWEWTSSLNKPYPFVPSDGREAPSAPGDRVYRGGSFVNVNPQILRVANRASADPRTTSDSVGFRCAYSRD
jgi:formylglycine-generating enzyme required for sulfatase activity